MCHKVCLHFAKCQGRNATFLTKRGTWLSFAMLALAQRPQRPQLLRPEGLTCTAVDISKVGLSKAVDLHR